MRHPSRGDERIEALRPLLRDRGLVLTPQRRAILRALIDLDEHPTADRVHAVLRRRRVGVRCDRVIDFSDARLDALPVPDTGRLGFVVSDYQVHVRGTCKQCREQEERA